MSASTSSLGPLEAYQCLMAFARTRGEDALKLAAHAAVAQSFQPDLLHLLRLNFIPEAKGDLAIESDVLLAPFCLHLGGDYFELDPDARTLLLEDLHAMYTADQVPRVKRVAAFLVTFIEDKTRNAALGRDRLLQDYLETQRWLALAYLHPDMAAAQLARVLDQATAKEPVAARLRISGLVSTLAAPLVAHSQLLTFAAAVDALQSGRTQQAQDLFSRLPRHEIKVGSVSLRAPKEYVVSAPPTQGGEKQPVKPKVEPALKPILVHVSYSRRDEQYAEVLLKHLAALEKDLLVAVWNDRQIKPGNDWETEIRESLERAQIVLLLVSADYLVSDYCQKELATVLRSYEADRRPWVVPIILRPCSWERSPLAKYQVLPRDGRAIAESRNQDGAWMSIVRDIEQVAARIRDEAPAAVREKPQPAPSKPAKVYISATRRDLIEYVEAARSALLRSRQVVISWAGEAASEMMPLEKSYADIAACDVFVSIVGFRYGHIPADPQTNPDRKSLTELEFEAARRLNKPIVAFLLGDDARITAQSMDLHTQEGDHGRLIEKFRYRLREETNVRSVSTPEELAAGLASGIERILSRAEKAPATQEPPSIGTDAPAGTSAASHSPLMTLDQLVRAVPDADAKNLASYIEPLNASMKRFEINTPNRIAAFIAHVAFESHDFRSTEENLNFSWQRLRQLWPKQFPSDEFAQHYDGQPEKIANLVYANRLGNRDVARGDGWRYRGRGLIQIAGAQNYSAYSKAIADPSVMSDPDQVARPPHAALCACWFWSNRGWNKLADDGDEAGFNEMIRRINGGSAGAEKRRANWARARAVFVAS